MRALIVVMVLLLGLPSAVSAASGKTLEVTVDAAGIRASHAQRYPVNAHVRVVVHVQPGVALDDFAMTVTRTGAEGAPIALRWNGNGERIGDVVLPAAGAYDVAMTARVGGVRYPAPPVTIVATNAPLATMPVRTVALAAMPFLGALFGFFYFRRGGRLAKPVAPV